MEWLDGNDCSLELMFNRRWKHVSVIRSFVQNFLSVNLPGGPTTPERVAMAVSELMENAVKYASAEGIRIRFAVATEAPPLLKVSIENKAEAVSIQTVRELYSRVMAGESLETYLTMMRESAARGDGKSQLGLIRIRHESGCRLGLETTADTIRFTLEL